MAFLDNSGDIILDAVLTDLGRMRMATGDFGIVKFALGDDEVDYSLYDINHISGSAYYDLKIMQTPVLEAFTNNTSVIKSNLMTLGGTALYLPVLKINQRSTFGRSLYVNAPPDGGGADGGDIFLVIYDSTTKEKLDGTRMADSPSEGVNVIGGEQKNYLDATSVGAGQPGHTCVDQGLDTPDISPLRTSYLDGGAGGISLKESEYMVEIDNRLGRIVGVEFESLDAGPSDDDNMSAYIISEGSTTLADMTLTDLSAAGDDETFGVTTEIQGPRGTRIRFKIESTGTELAGNDNLLDKLGRTLTSAVSTTMFGSDITSTFATVKYLDTNIRVRGMTTGYAIDIPFRFLKII